MTTPVPPAGEPRAAWRPNRRTVAGSVALAAALLAGGCGWLRRPDTAVDTPQYTDADRHFALQAAASVQYVLEAARLADLRATDPQVRGYATMLMQQNARAFDELRALMQAGDLAWEGGMPAERRAVLDAMASLSADLFERRFVEQVGITDHEADLALFERASQSVGDPALRAWAERMVPLLQQHLSVAHQLPVRLVAALSR